MNILYAVVLSGSTFKVIAPNADEAIRTAKAYAKTTKTHKKCKELWSVNAEGSVDAISSVLDFNKE